MKNIYTDLTQLIGHTPLLELVHYNKVYSPHARIVGKLECFNPASSVKDRVALSMIEDAERRGMLLPGGEIIEPTSGNTGIGLAWVATVKGYKVTLTMPDTMSVERRSLLKALGAHIVLTPGTEGMAGAIAKAEELVRATPGAIILQQFTNPANPLAHYRTTAREIWDDTEGSVDILVSAVGTGGTVSGVGLGLKEHNPGVRVVAVEPASSPVLSGGKPGAHRIQGIGAGFVPDIYNKEIVDEVLTVTDDQAIFTSREVARLEGLLVGISSGAALFAAKELALRPENEGKMIIVILPDTGERYLSTALYDNENYPLP